MALDLQRRQTQHGNPCYHTRHETENSRLVLHADLVKRSEIAEMNLALKLPPVVI